MKRKGILLTLALVLFACIVYASTASGAQTVQRVKGQVKAIIASFVPEKKVEIMVEGVAEEITYEPITQQPQKVDSIPGFTIHIDVERYEMIEENGMTYIRAIQYLPTEESIRESNSKLLEGLTPEEAEAEVRRMLAERLAFYDNLPNCEIEILYLPDIHPLDAAQSARPEDASPIQECQEPAGVYFTYSEGMAYDSLQEDVYFTSDGNDGTFQLTLRYYLEASEGHGVRMRSMLQTFTLVEP